MKWWKWIISLLPAGIGIIIISLISGGIIANPVLYLRGHLAAVALYGGLIISAILLGIFFLWERNLRGHEQEILDLHKETTQERRRFLQRLDHELKNPLTAVRTGLLNIEQATAEEMRREELEAVDAQVVRISRLVADLRKLTALETTPIERSDVDMRALLDEVVGVIQDRADFADRQLSLLIPNAPWPLPMVEGDPDLLLLAIHNLLDNAVKFSSPESAIEVRAFEDGRELVIEIADTGLGIPEGEIEHVWEELYRGERARGVPGSGLGLSLVRAIVEGHSGNISLRSRQDQGTVFNMRLPIKRD
jgi:two-component system OmpR family sensor kinase